MVEVNKGLGVRGIYCLYQGDQPHLADRFVICGQITLLVMI